MESRATVAAYVLAAPLLFASILKFVRVQSASETIRQLGFHRSPRAAARMAGALEATLALALALHFRPWPVWLAATALWFLVLCAVGLYAILAHLSVECSCFGSRVAHRLGWRQVVQFPVALGLCLVAWRGHDQTIDTTSRLLALVIAILAWEAVNVAAATRKLRQMRKIIETWTTPGPSILAAEVGP